MEFYKYQGTGNDFVIIDNRSGDFPSNNNEYVAFLCNRKFGVGADGLMLLENEIGYDFRMVYYNSDGNLSSMCGNGGRCIVAFANRMNIINDKANFIAVDGPHEAVIKENSIISLKMKDVSDIEITGNDFFLNTGSPHFVRFTENLDKLDILNKAREIRYNERFNKEGVNVNFLEVINGAVKMRTYERGVENETLSCGTGVTAAALCSVFSQKTNNSVVDVITQGGKLKVVLNQTGNGFDNIWLEGPAEFVFKGEIND
jgi:diaminopimelate epimerase